MVSEGVALGKFVEAGALVDAIKNGTNLGNDLSNLFSQIKGGSDSDLGNYKFKKVSMKIYVVEREHSKKP